MNNPIFGVSEAVAIMNQTFDAVYPTIVVVGELANFKIAKQKWVYGDIKDDYSKLRLFGTIYQLPGPIEDGMMLELVAEPRLHPQFGFNLNIKSLRPVGEGSIKKAANLLQAKLEKEGLFAIERKRPIPDKVVSIGLLASEESAAYGDFIKILNARWQGVEVFLYNVLVQGEQASESVLNGLSYFNQQPNPPEVIVVIRGGGSADDLAVFSTEQVTRAIASSRIPTVVAIGHEADVSLGELAADLRASTPSNAAEILFPDKYEQKDKLNLLRNQIKESISSKFEDLQHSLDNAYLKLNHAYSNNIEHKRQFIIHAKSLLESVHPRTTLNRGYAIIESGNKLISKSKNVKIGDELKLTLKDGRIISKVKKVE